MMGLLTWHIGQFLVCGSHASYIEACHHCNHVRLNALLLGSGTPSYHLFVYRVRGRHRGLPLAVDRAVLLPSEMVVQTGPKSKVEDNTHNVNNSAA